MSNSADDQWPEPTLTDVFDIRSGLSKPASEFGTGFPFVTFKDVLDNIFLPRELRSLVRSTETERLFCSVQRGDVFLTRTSETQEDLGMSSVALRNYDSATFNGFTKRLRPKDPSRVVPEYAAYFFRSNRFRRAITAFSSLSTRASLNNDMLSRLRIALPDVSVQEAIGYTLKSLDDKIEQNQRTSAALERLARAMFRAWFVDFEPIKVKAAGATAFPSMPQAVFDALPIRLVDSELGPVPEGWEVKPLSSQCEIISGGTPKRSVESYWNGEVPWYSVKDAPDAGVVWVWDTEERITQEGLDKSAAQLVPKGCTIISARGTVGKLALVGQPMAFNQSCYGLLPLDGSSYSYLHHLVREVVGELQQRSHGSVFDTITRATLDGIIVVAPRVNVVKEFHSTTVPLLELVLALLRESARLSAMRQYLLPKLLSGEVRVRLSNA